MVLKKVIGGNKDTGFVLGISDIFCCQDSNVVKMKEKKYRVVDRKTVYKEQKDNNVENLS